MPSWLWLPRGTPCFTTLYRFQLSLDALDEMMTLGIGSLGRAVYDAMSNTEREGHGWDRPCWIASAREPSIHKIYLMFLMVYNGWSVYYDATGTLHISVISVWCVSSVNATAPCVSPQASRKKKRQKWAQSERAIYDGSDHATILRGYDLSG